MLVLGGGLAGLAAALDLAGRGHRVAVVERRRYPFHRVCGEYVSNEVLPYLRRLGADPAALAPAAIRRFGLSSPAGRTLASPLDLGGFGVSRYQLDDFLYHQALKQGVEFIFATVAGVAFDAAAGQHQRDPGRWPPARGPAGAGHLRQAQRAGPAAGAALFWGALALPRREAPPAPARLRARRD